MTTHNIVRGHEQNNWNWLIISYLIDDIFQWPDLKKKVQLHGTYTDPFRFPLYASSISCSVQLHLLLISLPVHQRVSKEPRGWRRLLLKDPSKANHPRSDHSKTDTQVWSPRNNRSVWNWHAHTQICVHTHLQEKQNKLKGVKVNVCIVFKTPLPAVKGHICPGDLLE